MPQQSFKIVLIKPSHYDEDGYVIQWWRSTIPSNSLASVHGLLTDCAANKVLGTGVDISEVEPRVDAKRARQPLSLGMVLRACPDVAMYTRNGIKGWPDFIATAGTVRGALGISPSAWDEARKTMGDVEASITIAGILQRAEEIKSAGGYLRNLTEKSKAGRFSTGPMIMALMQRQAHGSGSKSDARRHEEGACRKPLALTVRYPSRPTLPPTDRKHS